MAQVLPSVASAAQSIHYDLKQKTARTHLSLLAQETKDPAIGINLIETCVDTVMQVLDPADVVAFFPDKAHPIHKRIVMQLALDGRNSPLHQLYGSTFPDRELMERATQICRVAMSDTFYFSTADCQRGTTCQLSPEELLKTYIQTGNSQFIQLAITDYPHKREAFTIQLAQAGRTHEAMLCWINTRGGTPENLFLIACKELTMNPELKTCTALFLRTFPKHPGADLLRLLNPETPQGEAIDLALNMAHTLSTNKFVAPLDFLNGIAKLYKRCRIDPPIEELKQTFKDWELDEAHSHFYIAFAQLGYLRALAPFSDRTLAEKILSEPALQENSELYHLLLSELCRANYPTEVAAKITTLDETIPESLIVNLLRSFLRTNKGAEADSWIRSLEKVDSQKLARAHQQAFFSELAARQLK
ncbi:MAG: hypothetical protein S4CHLAM102_08770 [Chlamydiia bacterium]|nr:hypothetical protein [Chlamydiia bacterium]